MESEVILQISKKMLNKLKACFVLGEKYSFHTINIYNVVLHELQIDLKNLLKNLDNEGKKQVYTEFKYALNEFYKDAIIYQVYDNENKTGFIIQPTKDTDMSMINQYTIVILDECNDIIA